MITYFKIFSFLLLFCTQLQAARQYFCTAVNEHYYHNVLNLIGSIHKISYDNLGHIAIYDLGLTDEQRAELERIEKVGIYSVEKRHPDLLTLFQTTSWGKMVPGWYAWKPVVIKQALELFPYVLWIDAGTTLLRPIDHVFDYIIEQGYFLGTIGSFENGINIHPLGNNVTQFVSQSFHLSDPIYAWINKEEHVMGNLIGVKKQSSSFFLNTLYDLAADLRYFQDDGTAPLGFGWGRHDQALFSIVAYQQNLVIHKLDPTQQEPMQLSIAGTIMPLYITWHGGYVSGNTHIYHSRGDLANYQNYLCHIHHKSS